MRRLARYVYYAVAGGVLLLFLVGYAARYVHPRYAWWVELVGIGLPYLVFAVVLSAGVAAVLRRWRLLAVHAAVLALAALRFGVPLPAGDGAEAEPSDLHVMTFNVPRWGGSSGNVKTQRLSALLRRTEPDLLALQEAFTAFVPENGALADDTRSYVRPLTKPPLDYHAARALSQKHTPQPVFAQVPLYGLSQKTLRVEDETKEDVTYVVRTGFRWRGRRAVLYNVHLRSFGSDKPWRAEDPHLLDLSFWKPYLRQYRDAYHARAREVERIREMLEQETRPVLIAGDFNSTPHSWAYRQLSQGMQDAFYVAGNGWGSTYHARLPFARIDFILASEEWKITDARVPDADLSDHRPLLASLRWRD